ncbi:Methyl-accepting chemotaxis protein [hydrothermal vent metagenome]|uniref:Methyl-accepting chemotaxis protein n=1 Tax=hydrothermal vent metagenome TaxID=652676 RepID=A0A1W1BBF8_9ZZZZ
MEKDIVLKQLRSAKAAHISWVQKAKLLIEGIDIDKSSIPINSTECKFGQWFYNDAQKLNGLRNNSLDCMENIENYHGQLHDIYLQIFKLYYLIEDKGFFANLFSSKKKIGTEVTEKGREHFLELEKVSKELLSEIARLERRVIAISNEEIAEL